MRFFIRKYGTELLVSFPFILISVVLNFQFLDGSNINYVIAGHDEYLTIREVYSILNPISWKHFILAVISGDVLYYGRIIFYTDALLAFIPYKVWGISGMVFAVRMTHSLFLVSSLFVLSAAFIKEKMLKVIFLLSGYCILYSLYFMMMPKPEPFQLLLLALFFIYFNKNGFKFGKYFIILGMAYGAKFNIIILMPFLFLLPFFAPKALTFKSNLAQVSKSILYFILGVFISIPSLILSPIRPIYLKTYLHETIGGTVKSYDDKNLSFFDWVGKGLGGSYFGISIGGYVWLLFTLIILFILLARIRKEKVHLSFVLIFCGLILNLVIMFNTKRMWPHYLWTGYLLTTLGIVLFIQDQENRKIKILSSAFLALLTAFSIVSYFNGNLIKHLTASKDIRSVLAYSSGCKAIEYVKLRYPRSMVSTDGSLFYAFKDFLNAYPYHPFAYKLPEKEMSIKWNGDHPEEIWNQPSNIIIFYKRHPETLLRENSKLYPGQNQNLYRNYKNQLKGSFHLDTVFNDVTVYKRN